MGCDYYICKMVCIYFDDFIENKLTIEIERKRGYFNNSDEDYNEYKKKCLTPVDKPIIIYSNNNFIKQLYEDKYKNIIGHEIRKYNKEWHEISKIVQIETRFERF